MKNIMKFFNNSYELDSSIPMEEEDPLVGIMENEIKSLLQNKGINVVKITSEYEECIDSIDIELEDKVNLIKYIKFKELINELTDIILI